MKTQTKISTGIAKDVLLQNGINSTVARGFLCAISALGALKPITKTENGEVGVDDVLKFVEDEL
jgi:hypothetical protein